MKKCPSPYASLIAQSTGARGTDLPKVENIMREEILHSTLDWQTKAQLAEAATQAYQMLRNHRAFYEMLHSHRAAIFEESRAEARKNKTAAALSRAAASGNTERIAKLRLIDEKAAVRLAWTRRKREVAAEYVNRVAGVQ